MPLPNEEIKINFESEKEFKENPKLYFPTMRNKGFECLDADIEQIDNDYIRCFNSYRIDERNYGSRYFWEKFKNSKEITIIDKYLSEKELSKILEIIEHWRKKNLLNTQIEKFTIYLYEPRLDDNIKTSYKKIKEIICNKFKIYSTQKKQDDLIHDRFAILDEETFHFGGTVGGYQKGFTAFSCGWSNKGIMKLFEYLLKDNHIYEVKNL